MTELNTNDRDDTHDRTEHQGQRCQDDRQKLHEYKKQTKHKQADRTGQSKAETNKYPADI